MAVLDGLMASLNASEEASVTRSFNFAYVRFTGVGEVKIFENPGDYHLSYFRERTEANRWKRSACYGREVVHVGSDTLHFDTQCSRYHADESIIGSYTSHYAVTCINRNLGIQARPSFAL